MQEINHLFSEKISTPRIGVNTIWRNRLITILQEYQSKKLTLLTAPTGYGKTVLISQFASIVPSPVVWYNLDDSDNDFSLFLQYFVAAIAKDIVQFGSQLLNYLQNNRDTSVRTISAFVINELEARVKEGLIIILDDYHLIHNQKIHAFMDELIRYLPLSVHVIISSRHVLPMNFSRLWAHGLVNDITYHELKFQKDEIRQLFGLENIAQETMIDDCYAQTDGWAVALSLIETAFVQHSERINKLPLIWENREAIYQYFAEEVFSNLQNKLQVFLIRTAILDTLTPGICSALTGEKESADILEQIVSKNLFLTRIEGGIAAYQFHHLFKEFLQTHLGNEKEKLYEQAGCYYSHAGSYERSVEYFLAANAFASAVADIEKIAVKIIKSGNISTIKRWMKKIPDLYVKRSPYLMLLMGTVYNYSGLWDEAIVMMDEALSLFVQVENQECLLHVRFQKAIVLRRAGHLTESIEVLDEAIAEAGAFPIRKWYDIVLEKVNTLLWSGELRRATETLFDVLNHVKCQNEPGLTAFFMEHLGATYYTLGEYYKAVDYYDKANEIYQEFGDSLSEFEYQRYAQTTTLAKIYRDWGELEKARYLLESQINTLEGFGLIDGLPRAYHELALVYADLGDTQKAEHYFKTAGKFYQKLDRKDFQFTWYLALSGNTLINSGKINEGKTLILQSIEYAKNNSEFNLAVCEFVGCMAFLKDRDMDKGIKLLEHSLAVGRKVGAKNLICQCCWVLSNVYAQLGLYEKSIESARECFAFAAQENYIQVFLSYEHISFPIIRLALELGIEAEFIDKIVFRLGSRAIDLLNDLKNSSDFETKKRVQRLLNGIVESTSSVKKSDQDMLIFVYSFGNFEVFGRNEHKAIRWKTAKAMELFAYFLNHSNKTIGKDKILEDIWPEMNPEQTSNWLYTYIYQIRTILKKYGMKNALIYTNKGYRLETEYIRSDVQQFRFLVEKINNQANLEDKDLLEEAVLLYKGDFMEGCYNQWIIDEKNQLEQTFLTLKQRLAEICIQTKLYGRAVDHLQSLLEKEPLSEQANEMLIRVLELKGDRIAAINHYETYCKTLENDLGIQPAKEMRKQYKRLKVQ